MKMIALHIKNLSMLKKKKEIYRNCFMCMWGFDFTMPSNKGSYAFCQCPLVALNMNMNMNIIFHLIVVLFVMVNWPWKKEKL